MASGVCLEYICIECGWERCERGCNLNRFWSKKELTEISKPYQPFKRYCSNCKKDTLHY